VRVEIFFKIVVLDILTPLTPALDGDTAIFSTAATVDFGHEVSRHVTCNRRAVPHRLASIWPDGWSALDRRRTGCGRCMCHWGVRILRRRLASPLMKRRIDGNNDELIDVATSLLCR
jgi:hypothetical protein